MRKIIYSLVVLIFSTHLAFAVIRVDLSEHGSDLKKASFIVRQKFSYLYHRDWMDSTYNQRQEFLTAWHIQNIKDAILARDRALKENRAKAVEIRAANEKRKAEKWALIDKQRKQREKDRAEVAKRKAFDQLLRDQKRKLRLLQRSR